jgi:hypothetical protein
MFDPKGNHCIATKPIFLRSQIPDLHGPIPYYINLKSYIVNLPGCPQEPFKIKIPYQTVRKMVKASQGKSRVFSSKKFAFFYPAEISQKQGNSSQNTLKNVIEMPRKHTDL